MLAHDSSQVRLMALNRLLDVCKEHKEGICQMVSSSAQQAAYSGQAGASGRVVSQLLGHLLELSVRETVSEVIDACGACLGEIGAVDPGLVRVLMHKKDRDRERDKPPTGGASGGTSAVPSLHAANLPSLNDVNNSPPWEMDVLRMGMALLWHHLVPGMKSSDSAGTDHTGFAVQAILRTLGDELASDKASVRGHGKQPPGGHGHGTLPPPPPPQQQQQQHQQLQLQTTGVTQRGATPASMPDRLKDMLDKAGILEITLPYWHTRYSLKSNIRLLCPVYHADMGFVPWLSRWLRTLLFASAGDLHELFDACKGVLKTRSALSQMILPFVVVGAVLNPHQRSEEQAMEAIKTELCTVLRGGRHECSQEEPSGASASPERDASVLSADRPSLDPNPNPNLSADRPSLDGEAADSVGAPDPMAVQAVFSLLDTLSAWASRGHACRPRSGASKGSGSSVGGGMTITDEQCAQAYCNGQKVRKLVDLVPKPLLCQAALSIRAYARGLRYFEQHLRQLHCIGREEEMLSSISSRSSDGRSPRVAYGVTSAMQVSTHDGSNRELPLLSSAQLDKLFRIFSKLDDPDALQGLLVQAQVRGIAASATNRILEMEQTDDWLGALLEYGNGTLQSRASTAGGDADLTSGGGGKRILSHRNSLSEPYKPPSLRGKLARQAAVHSHLNVIPNFDASAAKMVAGSAAASSSIPLDPSPDTPTSEMTLADHERGRLRCLIELGHLDAVVDQALGTIHRHADLKVCLSMLNFSMPVKDRICRNEKSQQNHNQIITKLYTDFFANRTIKGAILPLGVEASWRLTHWDDLSEWICLVDEEESGDPDAGQGQGQPGTVGFVGSGKGVGLGLGSGKGGGGGTSSTAAWPARPSKAPVFDPDSLASPEDAFQISIGKLMLALRAADEQSFKGHLSAARLAVMRSLSAASMESYGRAYPLLVRLQVLHEIKEGFELCTVRAGRASPALQHNGAISNSMDVMVPVESTGTDVASRRRALLATWHWDRRLECMSPSIRHRSLVLAVRRSVLSAAALPSLVALNWHGLSVRLGQLGRFEAAMVALRCAVQAGLGAEEAQLQEARLLKVCP